MRVSEHDQPWVTDDALSADDNQNFTYVSYPRGQSTNVHCNSVHSFKKTN
jgi:hypothetical protein